MKEDSVASRLAVLQTQLQSLVPLFKVESLAPTAQLNLAGSSVPAAASPPPSYADPVPAAVARVSTAATTQVLSHSGCDSSESSLAPPTYVEGPSSVIDDDDKSVSVPAAKASHKAPDV